MNKFLTFSLVALVALVANQALAQCSNCSSGQPVFNQGTVYSTPANYSTQVNSQFYNASPVYNSPTNYAPSYSAPMAYAPTYSSPSYAQPMYSQYSQPVGCGSSGSCGCCSSGCAVNYGGTVVASPVYSSGCCGGAIVSGSGCMMQGQVAVPQTGIVTEGIGPDAVIESPAQQNSTDESTPPVPTPEPDSDTPTPSPEPEVDTAAEPIVEPTAEPVVESTEETGGDAAATPPTGDDT